MSALIERWRRNQGMSSSDETRKEPGSITPFNPKEGLPPVDLPRYAPAPIRRDPEIEAMMVSANVVLEQREKIRKLEEDNAHLLIERETWKARAEAKQDLLDATLDDLRKYRSFYDSFKARFRDVSVILLDIVRDGESALHDAPAPEPGSLPEPALNESDLAASLTRPPLKENSDEKV